MNSYPRTTAAALVAVVAILLVAVLALRGTWQDTALTLDPSMTFPNEPTERFEIDQADTFVSVFHEGCNETYRYSVEESSDEIRVHAELKQQRDYNACLSIFEERLELEEPVGLRRIVDQATGQTLHPSSDQ